MGNERRQPVALGAGGVSVVYMNVDRSRDGGTPVLVFKEVLEQLDGAVIEEREVLRVQAGFAAAFVETLVQLLASESRGDATSVWPGGARWHLETVAYRWFVDQLEEIRDAAGW